MSGVSVHLLRLSRSVLKTGKKFDAFFYPPPSYAENVKKWLEKEGYTSKQYGDSSLPLCHYHVQVDADLYRKLKWQYGREIKYRRDDLISREIPLEQFF